ncbi:MAG: extracellular solute-binding protein [Planctomycetes bacterium]|nr:extracellular solute-binding protein [Planctomycetota bacterium]MCB9871895.1 extracellular solute-binding protein [Planctomycetota bacterium]MCB9888845.1 extracellular solute-binding protein [Planctomycetota bacterium]
MIDLRPALCSLAALALTACGRGPDVQLYVALDQEHSQAMVQRFEAKSGMRVKARYDTEASKTVGLVSALIEEAPRPRCDVFWNNELAQTVRLAQKGVLQAYASPAAAGIPARYRDPKALWHGFAARARVFIVNTKRIPDPKDYPRRLRDLIDPKWKGQCAIARPLTGTTLTHFTALRLAMGEQKLDEFIAAMRSNEVAFLQSNGATMKETASGKLAFALTDTDDFHVALRKGNPVAAVFPDQEDGGLGTMLIPNSVAMVKGAPHPEAARKLIDFILSKEVEGLLAAARSAQIPLRADVTGPSEAQILRIGAFRQMAWEPQATAGALSAAATHFAKVFGG